MKLPILRKRPSRARYISCMLFAALLSHAAASPADRFMSCLGAYVEAHKINVLYEIDRNTTPPNAVIGAAFYALPFDTKEKTIEAVNCILMGGRPGAIDFDVRDWRTGKTIGRFSFGHFILD